MMALPTPTSAPATVKISNPSMAAGMQHTSAIPAMRHATAANIARSVISIRSSIHHRLSNSALLAVVVAWDDPLVFCERLVNRRGEACFEPSGALAHLVF